MSQANLNLFISPRQKDLDGFTIRRLLPFAHHRMVGPFIFFDHMGPAEFKKNQGINVRPHPHINLATVTYLFEGKIHHRDSLGSNQVIEPGAINWMVAGKGIVHSERATEETKLQNTKLNGIQLWIALPTEVEEIEPSFTHHPKHSLPELAKGEDRYKLLLGTAMGMQSPVKVYSDLFYVEAKLKKGLHTFSAEGREACLYVVTGKVCVHGQEISAFDMALNEEHRDIEFEVLEDSHVLFLGGQSLGPRHIFWNFVSSSEARIEEAKRLWKEGPHQNNSRFQPIPGDSEEFIPL